MSIALNKPDYGSLRQGLGVVYEITTLGYSRQDELLADYLGAKYAYQAGYGTKGAINALRKLEKSSHHGQQPFFLRSHPLPDERVKQLEKRIREFNS
jgi:predicted Zn-dependent protease